MLAALLPYAVSSAAPFQVPDATVVEPCAAASRCPAALYV
jgi:hypothetical protein